MFVVVSESEKVRVAPVVRFVLSADSSVESKLSTTLPAVTARYLYRMARYAFDSPGREIDFALCKVSIRRVDTFHSLIPPLETIEAPEELRE